MYDLVLAAAAALTCVAGYLLATRRLGLSAAGLRAAMAAPLETIGLGALFFLGNLAVIVIPLLGSRALGATFLSIYGIDYVALASVSLLQGLVLRWWRRQG